MPTLRLTKRAIECLPLTASGQVLYRDTELVGFGVRVGSRTKAFFVEAQVARETVRVTLGRFGPLSPEGARKMALSTLAEMAQDIHPLVKKRALYAHSITLRQAFHRFFESKPGLSPSSRSGYGRSASLYLADWADRPIREITRTMILQRHQMLASERGAVTANNVMRHLRSVYNFIGASTQDLPPNPVSVLSQARNWIPEKRRQRLIPPSILPAWYEAVIAEPPLARDYLLMADCGRSKRL